MPASHIPTTKSVLVGLTAERLIAVGRDLEIALETGPKKGKEAIVQRLLRPSVDLPKLVRVLGRDELRAACRAHGLPDESRSRAELAERILAAASLPTQRGEGAPGGPVPVVGNVVQVR